MAANVVQTGGQYINLPLLDQFEATDVPITPISKSNGVVVLYVAGYYYSDRVRFESLNGMPALLAWDDPSPLGNTYSSWFVFPISPLDSAFRVLTRGTCLIRWAVVTQEAQDRDTYNVATNLVGSGSAATTSWTALGSGVVFAALVLQRPPSLPPVAPAGWSQIESSTLTVYQDVSVWRRPISGAGAQAAETWTSSPARPTSLTSWLAVYDLGAAIATATGGQLPVGFTIGSGSSGNIPPLVSQSPQVPFNAPPDPSTIIVPTEPWRQDKPGPYRD